MKKVLIIARTFPPFRSVGHSIRVVKFIKYLPALGWLPVVLTIDDRNEYETMRKVGSETMLSDVPPEVKIYRTAAGEPSLKFLDKERELSQRNRLLEAIVKLLGGGRRWIFRNLLLPDRSLTWLPFALTRARQIIKNEGIDVILATCPPHSVALIGAFLKLLTRKPLILDFRDDWIDTPWFYSRPMIVRAIERRQEKWAVKMADKVVLVTEWSKRAFRDRYHIEPEDKFVFIPNGCDLGELDAIRYVAPDPPNSKFTIVHAGSLNESKSWRRSPGTFIQALQNLVQQQPDLAEKMTMIFAGDLPKGYRQLVEEMTLSGVIRELGHVSHDEVLRLIKSANLLLAISYEGFSTQIPGKIYEYWAVGSAPILLLSCSGAARELVERNNLGLTVHPDDVTGIEKAILTAYRRRAAGDPMRVNTAGIEEYNRRVLAEKLKLVLSTAVNP